MDNQNQFSPRGFRLLPPVIKNLIIINVLFFLASMVFEHSFGIDLNEKLALHYFNSGLFRPYQLATYMFMHGGFFHILFNMFALWMFGYALEDIWGPKRFLFYYLATGIGAGIIQMVVQYLSIAPLEHAIEAAGVDLISIRHANYDTIREIVPVLSAKYNVSATALYTLFQKYSIPTLGASGAVYGILLAFGMIFPNVLMFFLFIPIPVKAKWVVIFYGAVELYAAFSNNPNDNVAHFAHLGGMVFGFILIKYWQRNQFNRFY